MPYATPPTPGLLDHRVINPRRAMILTFHSSGVLLVLRTSSWIVVWSGFREMHVWGTGMHVTRVCSWPISRALSKWTLGSWVVHHRNTYLVRRLYIVEVYIWPMDCALSKCTYDPWVVSLKYTFGPRATCHFSIGQTIDHVVMHLAIWGMGYAIIQSTSWLLEWWHSNNWSLGWEF